jgi:tetratricopeptide (TPR) repeat protein
VAGASNEKFAQALAESGISAMGLARRVRDLAKAHGGKTTATDHTAVARWLAGQKPRPATAKLVAEVLSRRLGRKVTEADLGFTAPIRDPVAALTYHHDAAATIEAATELFRSDVHRRREFLTETTLTAAAFAVPAVRYLTAPSRQPSARLAGRQIGTEEVRAVRAVTATFRALDNQFGGGYGRSSITAYLNDQAAPMLKQATYTAEIGSALYSAVAELMLLAGWMAYDLEQHTTAAGYLIQALSLTEQAGDNALGAEILAGMSHQAAYLGQPEEAVDMARVAGQCAKRAGQPVLTAEALAAEAHGHALAGNPRSAIACLTAAEHALESADPANTPAYLAYFDAAYLAAKTAQTLRDAGDPTAAVEHARRSLHMQAGYDRGRVFNLVLLATAHTQAGHVDQAAATGSLALAQAGNLNSARTRHYLRDLARRLERHHDVPEVAAFRDHARALLTSRPAAPALPSAR